MLFLRSCPRCKTGAVYIDSDPATVFCKCLNCGWMLDVADRDAVRAVLRRRAAGNAEEGTPPAVA